MKYLKTPSMGIKEFLKLILGTELSLSQLALIKNMDKYEHKFVPRRTGTKEYYQLLNKLIK